MEVLTTDAGLRVHTVGRFGGAVIGESGRRYPEGAGVAPETRHVPDSPPPDSPSPALRLDEEYRSRTDLRFASR